jgi:2-dehydropantoate 2-reductase
MHFLVVGAGAMGCLFAARLKKAGFEVDLCEKDPERAERIRDQGITVEAPSGHDRVMVPVLSGKPAASPQAAVIFVKSNDTEEASLAVAPWLEAGAVVLTLQNGLGNVEILEKIFGKARVLGGVTSEGATVLDHGRIRHAGEGQTSIGPSGEAAERIVSALRRAGFTSETVADIQPLIWGKLLVNAGINALAALTGLRNGRLPQVKGLLAVMEAVVREAKAVADARHVILPYPDPIAHVLDVCRATSGNVASMLQDVLNKRVTEIAFINGAIVREGKALGVPTPANFVLSSLVEAVQETYGERGGEVSDGTLPSGTFRRTPTPSPCLRSMQGRGQSEGEHI